MQERPVDGENCPKCGYVSVQDRLPLSLPIERELKGRYVVGRILGEPGGFGITYLSYDRLQEKRVAIKEYMPREIAGRDTDGVSVMPHSGKGSEEFVYGKEQFLGEAKTLARFDHANIVSVEDFFEENGTAYLVMEYYKGKPLDKYLADQPEGRMDPVVATEIMLRVLDGLKEVHKEGYLHRDVKPENVYLTAEGRPILIDFGAARQAVGERSRSLSIVMTEGYAPYEQYSRQGNQGPHTDVYGCGATLYRMVAGQKPPPATDRVMEDRLEEPRSLNSEVPKGLSQVIVEALAMGDEERIPTAEVFQDRLRAGLQGEIATPSSEEREPTASEQSSDASPEKTSAEGSEGSRDDSVENPSSDYEQTQAREKNAEGGRPGLSTLAMGALIVLALGLGGMALALYPSSEEVAQTTERQTTKQSATDESASEAGGGLSSGKEDQSRASKFLKAAQGDLEAGRLTKPEGANALAAVRQVLNRNPGSEEAQRLLGQIARQLEEKGNAARKAGNLTAAADFYERSLEIENQESVRTSLETVRSRVQKRERVEQLLSSVRSILAREASSTNELKEAQKQIEQVLALDADNQEASKLKEKVASRIAEAKIPSTGLIAHYPFDGNANDATGNGHDGTVNGASLTTDRFGNSEEAYNFDGNDDYIDLPDNTVETSAGSVCAWFLARSITAGENDRIFSMSYFPNPSGTRLYLSVPPDRNFKADFISDQLEGTFVNFGEWYHACFTWDINSSELYVNGSLKDSSSGGDPTNGRVNIGSYGEGFKSFLDGKIDEVRIYERALKGGEVKSIYYAQK